MKSLIKLVGVFAILAWAAGLPSPAKGATDYTCNNSYYSCQTQCENNVQLCVRDCPTAQQKGYCFWTRVCWPDGTCITNDDCTFAPDNSCGQWCASEMNNCINNCLQSYCYPTS